MFKIDAIKKSYKGKTNIARLTQRQSSCFVSRQSQVRILHLARGCNSAEECFPCTEEVAGSIPVSSTQINKQWRLYVICSFINICRCTLFSLPRCKRVNQKGMARSSSGQDSRFSSVQQGFDYPTGYKRFLSSVGRASHL